jgi:hypothetical protein
MRISECGVARFQDEMRELKMDGARDVVCLSHADGKR